MLGVMKATTATLASLLAAVASPALAGVDEIRLGVSAHDLGVLGHAKENGADINGEVLFESPEFLDVIWSPRPHLGISVNTSGYTDQVYAGLTWSFEPVEKVFVEFGFGGSVHDGKLEYNPGSNHKDLGTRALFRESVAVGYRIDERNSISIAFDHESNAGIGDHNPGLNNLGLRWGYRF
jgi:lipid A 3-O-deacylase